MLLQGMFTVVNVCTKDLKTISRELSVIGRGLLQAPVPQDLSAAVARDALTRLVTFQNAAAAQTIPASVQPSTSIPASAHLHIIC